MFKLLGIFTMKYFYVVLIGAAAGAAVGSAFNKFSSGAAFGVVAGILVRRILLSMKEKQQ